MIHPQIQWHKGKIFQFKFGNFYVYEAGQNFFFRKYHMPPWLKLSFHVFLCIIPCTSFLGMSMSKGPWISIQRGMDQPRKVTVKQHLYSKKCLFNTTSLASLLLGHALYFALNIFELSSYVVLLLCLSGFGISATELVFNRFLETQILLCSLSCVRLLFVVDTLLPIF